jgi:hypothetical protein
LCRRSAAVTVYSWPNSPTQTPIDAEYVLIAIGSQQQLSALQHPANQVD